MKKPWAVEEIDDLRRRYERGESEESIARGLGRTVGAVANCRQLHRIQRPRHVLLRGKPWTAEELALAAEMYARGDPNDVIADALGRSRIAIKRLVTGKGLRRGASTGPNPADFNTADEQWAVVSAVPEYAISTCGRVMTLRAGWKGRCLAQWVDPDGYAHVTLWVEGRAKRFPVHRVMALSFLGDPPTPQHQAAHNDGIPAHNRIGNIRWATPAENQADRLLHGTAARGDGGRFVPCRRAKEPPPLGPGLKIWFPCGSPDAE